MAPINVSEATIHECIRIVPERRTWLAASPILFMGFLVLFMWLLALHVISPLHAPRGSHSTSFMLPALMTFLALMQGAPVLHVLAARCELRVTGSAIHILRGTRWHLRDLGTYEATSITDLRFERSNGVLPGHGELKATCAGYPLVLAEHIHKRTAARIIQQLAGQLPVHIAEFTPSPAVTHW